MLSIFVGIIVKLNLCWTIIMAGWDVDFSNEDEVKEYVQNIEIEYMFGCEKEHNSDSELMNYVN